MAFFRNISIITVSIGLFWGWVLIPQSVSAQIAKYPLKIERVANSAFLNPGEPVQFTTIVSNQGPKTLSDIEVVDSWPANFIVNGLKQSETNWSISELAPGQSQVFNYNVASPGETSLGFLTFHSQAKAAQPSTEAVIDYALEMRQVKILASELPTTSGQLSKVDILGLMLIFQFMMIAILSLQLAKNNYATEITN